jgi:translation initiation factor IF-2
LSKLRVTDLANEFGVEAGVVVDLLKRMDIPVRSHLSTLTEDQVARARARWEREKRSAVAPEKAAPAAGRRRSAGAAKSAAREPSTPSAGGVRRRPRAAQLAAATDAGVGSEEVVAEIAGSAPAVGVEAAAAAVAEPAEPSGQVAEHHVALPAEKLPGRPETAGGEQGLSSVDSQAAPVEKAVPAPGAKEEREVPAPPPAARAAELPRPEPPRPRPVVPAGPRPVATGAPVPRPVATGTPRGTGSSVQRPEARPTTPVAPSPPSRRKKGRRSAVDQEQVAANIREVMGRLSGGPGRRTQRRTEEGRGTAEAPTEAAQERKTIRVNEFITVSELSQLIGVSAAEIVGFAFKQLGLRVTINQRLSFDEIELIADGFGFQAVREEEYVADLRPHVEDRPEDLKPRPPVVTIMGHVDHGKTSLLDYIRKSNVVAGEAGGITQHIGAYHVTLPNGREITFLDTPGHEAFTAMRARGAQVTDIVVLVVAANDSVMPQTIEAISHARNAGVPIIVAINKIDLPDADPDRVKRDLLQHGVVLEEFGGDVLSTPISAKHGTNVQELLDQILLLADVLDLKANPNRPAVGTVIEAQLDPGKGPVATVLVQQGTLRVGDDFICGKYSGRVRALLDERGKPVKAAGPAIPVQVLGFPGVPTAGDQFIVAEDAAQAREIAQRRERLEREAKSRLGVRGPTTLDGMLAQGAEGKRTLRLIIRADQGGPAEALADALAQLGSDEVEVQIIHRGVGAIIESDVQLAKAAGAMIIGFNVRPDSNARAIAERDGVEIRLYRVIYDAVADIRAALEGMLRPEEREVVLGEAEVRQVFKISHVGTVAGCYVRSGVITRQGRVRVVRDGREVYSGAIASLKRHKDDVREVKEGYECGILIENFNDIKVGDVIECYRKEEVARTLEVAGAAPAGESGQRRPTS